MEDGPVHAHVTEGTTGEAGTVAGGGVTAATGEVEVGEEVIVRVGMGVATGIEAGTTAPPHTPTTPTTPPPHPATAHPHLEATL